MELTRRGFLGGTAAAIFAVNTAAETLEDDTVTFAYLDGRPAATKRLNARDHGVVLP